MIRHITMTHSGGARRQVELCNLVCPPEEGPCALVRWGVAGDYFARLSDGKLVAVDSEPARINYATRREHTKAVRDWEERARKLSFWKVDVVDLRALQREWNRTATPSTLIPGRSPHDPTHR